MDDDEEAALRVCSMPHCGKPAGTGSCTGSPPHPLCDSCFRGYASAQFESSLGAFEQVLSKNGGISNAGELPCYLFLTGDCDCTSILSTTLLGVLLTDPEAWKLYENAKRRVILTQNDMERENENHDEPDLEDGLSLVNLLEAVLDALSRGGYVECPSCGKQGQKNEACMHMKCTCGTRYCYCCGREGGDGPNLCPSNGNGCDSPSAFLEDHPGWNNFALSGESRGIGALHEFHRRRMAYFLRDVKDNYPPRLWRNLQQRHPNILNGKPTNGRSISWEEIDTASAPLFGRTTEAQLKWCIRQNLSMRPMLENDEVQEEYVNEENNEDQQVGREEQLLEVEQVVPEEQPHVVQQAVRPPAGRVSIPFVIGLVVFACSLIIGVAFLYRNDKESRLGRAGVILTSTSSVGFFAYALAIFGARYDGIHDWREVDDYIWVTLGFFFSVLMASMMMAFAAYESPVWTAGFVLICIPCYCFIFYGLFHGTYR